MQLSNNTCEALEPRAASLALVKPKPERLSKPGKPRILGGRPIDVSETTANEFWSLVNRGAPTDCWEWQGAKDTFGSQGGYGITRNNKIQIKAHRVAYALTHGQIPVGLLVCHTCDNRSCCNLAHMWLGTHRDNLLDAISKGRAFRGQSIVSLVKRSLKNGHGHFPRKPWDRLVGFKLTAEQVLEIRRVYRHRDRGEHGTVALARKYGVCDQTILAIIHKKRWKHV